MAPYASLNVAQPLSFAMELHGVTWLTPLISVGALCGLSSVMLVSLLGQTRIFFAMASDGLLPAVFKSIHPKTNTPIVVCPRPPSHTHPCLDVFNYVFVRVCHQGTLVTGVFSALLAALVPLDVLGDMTSMGTLLAFILVCVAVVLLRRTQPDTPRPFRVPYVPYLPMAGCVVRVLVAVAVAVLVVAFRARLAIHGRV